MPTAALIERISRFIDSPDNGDFEQLALAAFSLQLNEIPAVRHLAASQGFESKQPANWRQIPLVPTLAFKSQPLHLETPIKVFRSSGTRGAGQSVHHHAFPDLYRQVVEQSFPRHCLPSGPPPPMLSLIPTGIELPESSLSFMIDHVLDRFGREDSVTATGRRGVSIPTARSWVGGRQRDGVPGLILTTSIALLQLLENLEKSYLHFRLAPGTRLFETGGYKGTQTTIDPVEQLARVQKFLGIPESSVVREFGMTELTSQAYATAQTNRRYAPPHWMRVRALDPETLDEVTNEAVGLLAFLDLGNVGSAVHVLTEDIGRVFPDGTFEYTGRASNAELRGCSLTAEELAVS